MPGKPRVSVVSAFYNRGFLVQESIGSLLTQTLRDIEIIIVNDGSTDDTAARLDELDDPRVRIIHQENRGFTAAIRRAVAECAGEYVALHGSGDISLPRRLELQAAYLDANEGVGLVGCRYTNNGVLMNPEETTVQRGPMLESFIKRNRISHGEAMFRKMIYEKVGGYRQAFTFAQDRDLWLRMGDLCEYAVIPDILYHRKRLPDGVFETPEKFYMQRKLSSFAIECAKQRRAGEVDRLDRFGPGAFYLTAPSKKLSLVFRQRALRLFREQRYEGGIFLARMSWREWRDLRSLAGVMLAWLALGGKRRSLLRRILTVRGSSQKRMGRD